MQTFQGLAVSDGLTVGPVVRIDRGAAGLHRIVCDPFRERALYEAAIVLAKDELNRLQQHACGQDADILMFQIALLEDESFTNEIGDYIAAGAGSAAAVERAEQIFAGRLKNVDDDYIRERSVDVCDACRRVVDILDGRPSRRLHLTEPSILAAELFYPSDLFGQAPGMILGLASETDSETSHAAIMARSMGIPAVFQLGKGVAAAAAGCRAVVDAEHAQLIIDPTAAQLRQVKARRQELQNSNALPDPLAAAPCRTRDGTPFVLLASAACAAPEAIPKAIQAGASGIGLLRTESVVIKELTEAQQVEAIPVPEETKAGSRPTLDHVACIGDSVMLGSAMALRDVLPDCYIDAKVSRYVGAGLDIARQMDQMGVLGNTVVISLGTNGPLDGQYEGQTKGLLDYLGPDRHIFWVTVHCPATGWQDSNNAYLRKIAAEYPNVTLVDWQGEVTKHPEWLGGDDIHPNNEGTVAYAGLIHDTIAAKMGGAA